MDTDPLAQVMADLYALPPEDFVAARNDAAKRARAAGDRRRATEIGALRRPTVGAWAVNLLARQRPELIDELLALGESLRSAQRELRGDDLRELSMRRRAAVAALSREAIRLARRDHRRDNLPAAEIEATLTAVLADRAVAEQVRAGRLTRAVAYAGFGETPRPTLRLIHGGEAEPVTPDGRPPARTTATTAKTATAAGKTAGKAPEKAAEAERRAAEKAARKAAEAERRAAAVAAAAERRRARAAAHRELLAARTELAEAEAARALAEKAVTAARRRVEKATAALDGLATDG